MSSYGFVYIMTNDYMSVFKLGCTERSPNARADELSRATGVPDRFSVMCFAEFDDFQAEEKHMHKWMDDYRANPGREFFHVDGLRFATLLLYWHPRRLSFSHGGRGSDLVPGPFGQLNLQLHNSVNPFEPAKKPPVQVIEATNQSVEKQPADAV